MPIFSTIRSCFYINQMMILEIFIKFYRPFLPIFLPLFIFWCHIYKDPKVSAITSPYSLNHFFVLSHQVCSAYANSTITGFVGHSSLSLITSTITSFQDISPSFLFSFPKGKYSRFPIILYSDAYGFQPHLSHITQPQILGPYLIGVQTSSSNLVPNILHSWSHLLGFLFG